MGLGIKLTKTRTMNFRIKFSTLLLLIIASQSCKDAVDEFYTEPREFRLIRIPLIHPCFAGSTQRLEGPWFLFDCYGYMGSMEVNYIDVLDSVIVGFYYTKWTVVPEKVDTTWHIIVPFDKTSYQYNNEKEFYNKLNEFTYRKPNFVEASNLWLEFKEKGYLEWFPKEYKH